MVNGYAKIAIQTRQHWQIDGDRTPSAPPTGFVFQLLANSLNLRHNVSLEL